MTTRLMELAPRLLVVAVVGEHPGLTVQRIGPVRIIHARCKYKHVQPPLDLASLAKSALAVNTQKPGQWIVTRISTSATCVVCVHMQIGGLKLFECCRLQTQALPPPK